MPSVNLNLNTPLSFLGTLAITFGMILILTGVGVIKIKAIVIMPGKKTLITGIIIALFGFLLLSFDGSASTSDIPASSAAPTLGPVSVYDDFENLSYEAIFNTDKWLSKSNASCLFAQKNGKLIISNEENDSSADCILVAKEPQFVSLNELGTTTAEIAFSDGIRNNAVNETLSILKSNDPPFFISCGLGAAPESIGSFFYVEYNRENVFNQSFPAEFDRAYTFSLNYDPKTFTFSCLASGQLIGSYSIKDILESLEKGLYERQINGWRSENSFAEAVVDNFSFGLP